MGHVNRKEAPKLQPKKEEKSSQKWLVRSNGLSEQVEHPETNQPLRPKLKPGVKWVWTGRFMARTATEQKVLPWKIQAFAPDSPRGNTRTSFSSHTSGEQMCWATWV